MERKGEGKEREREGEGEEERLCFAWSHIVFYGLVLEIIVSLLPSSIGCGSHKVCSGSRGGNLDPITQVENCQ